MIIESPHATLYFMAIVMFAIFLTISERIRRLNVHVLHLNLHNGPICYSKAHPCATYYLMAIVIFPLYYIVCWDIHIRNLHDLDLHILNIDQDQM